ncbi:MAG: MlaD family protein [Terriglobales bacterium]|jgi:phospholipid/cholesterol/gamma-HCH transport system substrate-binding protein
MVRKLTLVLMIVVGLAAIGSLLINPLRYSRQTIKSCFDDAGGLRSGAPVRIAGVNVGTVRSVRANPQNKNCPAEVEMALATTYEIRIPKDSIAETNTAGLIGEVYVNIDSTQASGAPIENYGYLKSRTSKTTLSLGDQLKAADVLLRLVRTFKEGEKEVPKETGAP